MPNFITDKSSTTYQSTYSPKNDILIAERFNIPNKKIVEITNFYHKKINQIKKSIYTEF